MAFDWIGCALNSLLGHQKEGREESLIHQTEILIDFQPAGEGREAPQWKKRGQEGEGGDVAEEEGADLGQDCVPGYGKRKLASLQVCC